MFNSYLGNTDEEFYAAQAELQKLMAQEELLEEQRKKRAMKKEPEAVPVTTEEPTVKVKYTGGEKIVVQNVMFAPEAFVKQSLADTLVKMPYFEIVVDEPEKKSFIEKLLT